MPAEHRNVFQIMEDSSLSDICRVCRSEGCSERPLFHPCICTGSIKWIHQDCLVQWMRYSRKEYCELCSHNFSFTPIYSPDMPRRLPLRDLVGGLLSSVTKAAKYWLHYTMVAVAWLGVVPLTSCRIYRLIFTGSIDAILSLPMDMLYARNIPSDVFHGCFVLACTLFSFIGIVWLGEQIVNGGGPDWLEEPANNNNNNNTDAPNNAEENELVGAGGVAVEEGPVAEAEEAERGENVDAGNAEVEARDDGHWNRLEWDHAAEELTWERLLGLDGTLLFLEHVFWVIWLNTLFILVFAFFPYHIGHYLLQEMDFEKQTTESHFAGILTTLAGYVAIGVTLLILHALASLFGLPHTKRFLGLCYVVIKVSLLSVVEICLLPFICGWWLDICSLALFDVTIRDREASFHAAPGSTVFIHWLVGMTYVYYFASFVLLLREILRPGVIWFLVNLNDPDFSPIQEMIHVPILQHVRRILGSSVIFGTAVLLMLWVPIKIMRYLWPTFLPYNTAVQSETVFNELSLELLLLQVILPALLEQSHTRVWIKGLLRVWCESTAWLLGLQSYLLGDPNQQERERVDPQADQDGGGGGDADNLGAVHQALMPREGRIGVQPYEKPEWFHLRIAGLLMAVAVSLMLISAMALTIPVWLGRQVMAFWVQGGPAADQQPERPTRVHELYTVALGTYMCWILGRAIALHRAWFPQGRAVFFARVKVLLLCCAKSLVAFAVLLGVVPLLFGLLVELVVVIPLRVPLDQTPVPFVWRDWALGVLYTKIACAVIIMGPDWGMKRSIERIYRDGIRNMDFKFLLENVALPVISVLGLFLAVPYVIAYSIVPLIFSNPHVCNLVARQIYPCILLTALAVSVAIFQIRQFRKLYEHIKNDKYLVGRRLVNYHHRHKQKISLN